MKKNNKGFTIIELLLVCSIIGVLTMTLVPSIGHVRTKSKEMALKSTTFKIQTLLESYYYDYGHYIKGTALTAADLYTCFKGEGYVARVPNNPFTGAPFSPGDTEGRIEYSADSGSYLLTAYKANGEDILLTCNGE